MKFEAAEHWLPLIFPDDTITDEELKWFARRFDVSDYGSVRRVRHRDTDGVWRGPDVLPLSEVPLIGEYVLTTFGVPQTRGSMYLACHLDGDAKNNRLDNLIWGTPDIELALRAARGGAKLPRRVCKRGHPITPFTRGNRSKETCGQCEKESKRKWKPIAKRHLNSGS